LLLELDDAQLKAGRKMQYEHQFAINTNRDIPDKEYVDDAISNYYQDAIKTADTQVSTSASTITNTVQSVDV